MLCRKNSRFVDRGSVPVHLNVYDLATCNGYAYWFGFGIYHSGIQVHGVEYAYGAHEYPTTGIFEGEPTKCEGFRFRESILIGKTDMGPAEVKGMMNSFAEEYRGNAYNLITKNCNHFCNHAVIRLTGNPIPSWVNRLSRVGIFCKCFLPATLKTTKVPSHKKEEQANEEDKNELTSQSNRIPSSTSSSSSSSSPQVRGRSRTRSRRSRTPASPSIRHSSPSQK